MSLVDIIIPTFNNWDYLGPCLRSILLHMETKGMIKIIVVNNGDKDSIPLDVSAPEVEIIHAGENLGWEGGLKKGLEYSKSEFVIFMNDDTYIPFFSRSWVNRLLEHMADPSVAAVGPSSNCVMGLQNIFLPCDADYIFQVNLLIGFCVMVRRSALDAVGGVDDSLPYHGDDLDLSIRFRKAGYTLICDKSIFVYHHGFKTGGREKGAEWNSVQMTERTNHRLIRKHGLKTFVDYIFNPLVKGATQQTQAAPDTEGDIVRKYAQGDILELGCGGQKTVPDSVGLDVVPKGEYIPGLNRVHSVADITADINEPIPFEDEKFDTVIARHLFEHLIDPIPVLRDWARVLRPKGRLILAVPDQSIRNTIPMNFQHVHAYTRESLKNLMELNGFKTETLEDAKNGISFVGIFEVNGAKHGHE